MRCGSEVVQEFLHPAYHGILKQAFKNGCHVVFYGCRRAERICSFHLIFHFPFPFSKPHIIIAWRSSASAVGVNCFVGFGFGGPGHPKYTTYWECGQLLGLSAIMLSASQVLLSKWSLWGFKIRRLDCGD